MTRFGAKVTKDGGLILHPSLAVVGDMGDVRGQDVSADTDAGFGQPISDSELSFAACREPVAHFLTYGVAADVTDKWFYVDDLDTKNPDVELDNNVQMALDEIDFREVLTEALIQARIYRKSLIVCAFDDAKDVSELKQPRKEGAKLLQFETYPKTENSQKLFPYSVDKKDDDVKSLRYGKPVLYRIDRGGGNVLLVHFSRCIEVDNKFSVLAPIFDDLVCGRNIRWGAAQWLYRTGGGFPVLGFPRGTPLEDLEKYCASGAFNDLMNRSYITLAQNSKDENDGMTIDFKGAANTTLNPVPFLKSNIEQISIATGIPQAKLVGAQAGALTGSNVNMQDYFKVISRIQNGLPTKIAKQVILWLAESGQITRLKTIAQTDSLTRQFIKKFHRGDYRKKIVQHFAIVWNSAFEHSEIDKAKIELDNVRSNQGKLDYMTIDEVRASEDLDPLPNKEGEKLKRSSLNELFTTPPSSSNTKENSSTPEQQLQQADKFLLVDLTPKPPQPPAFHSDDAT
ncbi:MAG: DUF1073 domain-containing protein [Candidatus Bathyarchaeota archaeon]|nr:DUF1073 domain-containing protein [Candidatus Termiticorpusculum sp.]